MLAEVGHHLAGFAAVAGVGARVDVEGEHRVAHLHLVAVHQRLRLALGFGLAGGRSGGESLRVFPQQPVGTDGLKGDLQDPVSVDDCSVLAALVHQHVALLLLVKVNLSVELKEHTWLERPRRRQTNAVCKRAIRKHLADSHLRYSDSVVHVFLSEGEAKPGITFPSFSLTSSPSQWAISCFFIQSEVRLYLAPLFLQPRLLISFSQNQNPDKPPNGGSTVGGDDEERANLQHRRPDHGHSDARRPNIFGD